MRQREGPDVFFQRRGLQLELRPVALGSRRHHRCLAGKMRRCSRATLSLTFPTPPLNLHVDGALSPSSSRSRSRSLRGGSGRKQSIEPSRSPRSSLSPSLVEAAAAATVVKRAPKSASRSLPVCFLYFWNLFTFTLFCVSAWFVLMASLATPAFMVPPMAWQAECMVAG